MKSLMILVIMMGVTVMMPSAHGDMLSGDLIKSDNTAFVLKDKDGVEHQLRFDNQTTITYLMGGKEKKVDHKGPIQPGAKVLTFQNKGYVIYLQVDCDKGKRGPPCPSRR